MEKPKEKPEEKNSGSSDLVTAQNQIVVTDCTTVRLMAGAAFPWGSVVDVDARPCAENP